jgi:hypothetical protein
MLLRALVIAWALITASPALAVSGWQAPQDLPVTASTFGSGIGIAGSGDSWGAWAIQDPASSTSFLIQAAKRPTATGTWGAVETVATTRLFGPAIAVDSGGDAIVQWNDGPGPICCGTVFTSFRSAGAGAWGAPQGVSPADQETEATSVALDPTGNAVATWTNAVAAASTRWAAVRPAATGQWQSARQINSAPVFSITAGTVATDAQRNAYSIWLDRTNSGASRSFSFEVATGSLRTGAWSAAQTLFSAPALPSGPQLAVSADGDVFALWVLGRSAYVAERPPAGPWGTPQVLSGRDQVVAASIAVDAQDDATLIWEQHTPSGDSIQARFRPGGGVWAAQQTISGLSLFSPPSADKPSVVMGDGGRAVAIWGTGDNAIVSASSAGAAVWTAPVVVAPATPNFCCKQPQLRGNAAGQAIALWGPGTLHSAFFQP